MKLTYLGTAAAEGFPAVFCNCAYCNEARTLGGKNIRTRSQALINEDLLIDLCADTYWHFMANGVQGHQIKNLLVTHPHGDHFYPAELEMHQSPFAHAMDAPFLDVYGGKEVCETLGKFPKLKRIRTHHLTPFEPTVIGDYTVTALPARHMEEAEAFIYIIEGDAVLLYAHDTGYFYEETLHYIQEKKLRFDLVSFDCTNVDIEISDKGGHMGLPNIRRLDKALAEMGAVDEKTVKIINHFSHNARPIQSVLEEKVKDDGYLVAYDGMAIEFGNK